MPLSRRAYVSINENGATRTYESVLQRAEASASIQFRSSTSSGLKAWSSSNDGMGLQISLESGKFASVSEYYERRGGVAFAKNRAETGDFLELSHASAFGHGGDQAPGQHREAKGTFEAVSVRSSETSFRKEQESGVFSRSSRGGQTDALSEPSEYQYVETTGQASRQRPQPGSSATFTETKGHGERTRKQNGAGSAPRIHEKEAFSRKTTTVEYGKEEKKLFTSQRRENRKIVRSKGSEERVGHSPLDMKVISSNTQLLSVLHQDVVRRDNPFFSRSTIAEREYNGMQELVRAETIKVFDLSSHSKAMVTTAATMAVHNLVSTSDGRIRFSDATKNVGLAGAKSFTSSLVAEKLQPFVGDNNGIVGSGLVNAGYSLAMGDKEAAAKVAFETGVNVVLNSVLAESLPLSYGHQQYYTPKGMFGKDVV